MPPPSLARSRSQAILDLKKLSEVLSETNTLPIRVQYLIAETVLLRATSVLETVLSECAFKLAAGAIYLDGSHPALLQRCSSMSNARQNMLSAGRSRPRQYLKWTRAKYIKESVRYVISPTDHYVTICERHGGVIAQIFKVRNFAAHRNTSSRQEYKEAVREVYGRYRPISLGQFLLSKHYVVRPNLQRYLIEARALVNELTKSS